MALEEKINQDIKAAMIAKDASKLRGLRAVKAAILLAKTEKGHSEELTEETEIKVLQKLVKQRKESAEIYKDQNREDLYAIEVEEQEVIEAYLPQQLSKEEVEKIIKEIISTTGASSVKDMGKVMAAANQQLAGKADGRTISELVKGLLA
ncbi:GatB/YqeY domain-containing protein [Sphingobacterium sp. SG20118]|uniref:GatB/YqeY domain-containing protein n=1 Tax=Sphingobacterium TaxID=28453 RepID=UPI0004F6E53D|nr:MULTISPECIES: GatB/YqeY domain-containing protein [Sphingobacterium]AIM36618.1 glutamyl-tRNA amidotransferase [Sphingobacterium sp. ML3W]MDH5827205.1 GatB/YqeY domain-containing protein [Sphingobacterium faecium]